MRIPDCTLSVSGYDVPVPSNVTFISIKFERNKIPNESFPSQSRHFWFDDIFEGVDKKTKISNDRCMVDVWALELVFDFAAGNIFGGSKNRYRTNSDVPLFYILP